MEIADFLARIKSEDPSRIIPFIGSGLVRSLGYPSWSSLLDDAAEFAARHSRDVASLMRNRLSRRDLLGAGDLLYEPEIPATELHNFFRSQFDKTPKIPEFLSDFFACAFPAYVTTNFDLTIEQAIAFGGRTPEPFRSTDRFKPFNSRLSVYSSDRSKVSKGALVLKLHGDVADPRFIVLGKRQLENMMEDESLGFLYKSLFWDYTILFLGFSGNDVNFIWQVETIRKVCGIPKAMSYFIHPNGEALPFSSSEVNMEEVTYSPLGDHAELQKALGSMSTVFSKPSQQIAFEFPASPSDEIRQTLAFVTAGLMEKAYEPSFECAAVSMVADAASRVGGLDNKDRLIDEISKTQNVGFDDAARILDSVDSESVVSAIESLADSQKKFNEMIEILREGIDKRSLAYGKPFVKTGSKSNMILYDLLLGVFSRAGKALAMSLLDSDPPDDSLIDRLIRKAIENLNNVGMGDLDKEVLLSVFASRSLR